MHIHLDIAESYRPHIEHQLIENAALATLHHQKAPSNGEVSIVITSEEQLGDLNSQFRGIDTPTDVLSFPSELTDPESGAAYLGDVVISYPRAEAQSQAGGHEIAEELQLLIVHGLLHLLGYDHANPKEKDRMWAIQTEILSQLGISNITLSE